MNSERKPRMTLSNAITDISVCLALIAGALTETGFLRGVYVVALAAMIVSLVVFAYSLGQLTDSLTTLRDADKDLIAAQDRMISVLRRT